MNDQQYFEQVLAERDKLVAELAAVKEERQQLWYRWEAASSDALDKGVLIKKLSNALEFCYDIALEEYAHQTPLDIGKEVTLRHIMRKCEEVCDG
jgi:hypothetical protein